MRILFIALCLLLVLCLAGCSVFKAAKIEGAVRDALAANDDTAQYDLEVTWQDDGSIYVTGEVWNPEHIDLIAEVIAAVPGVTGVQNHCAVPDTDSGLIQDTTGTGSLAF